MDRRILRYADSILRGTSRQALKLLIAQRPAASGGIKDRGQISFVNRDQEPRAGQAGLRTGRSSRYEVNYQIVETG